MVPSHTALSLAIGITLVAVAWLAYTTEVSGRPCPCLDQRYRRSVRLRNFTAGVLCRDACRGGPRHFARCTRADILAAALLLLLAVNIRNAWDLMLAFARQVATKSSDT
jgi:hypothetical protein